MGLFVILLAMRFVMLTSLVAAFAAIGLLGFVVVGHVVSGESTIALGDLRYRIECDNDDKKVLVEEAVVELRKHKDVVDLMAEVSGELGYVYIKCDAPKVDHNWGQAYWSAKDYAIHINADQSRATIMEHILFELLNASHRKFFYGVLDRARDGQLGRDEYSREVELVEYKTVRRHHQIASEGVTQHGWKPEVDSFALTVAMFPRFEQHYALQNTVSNPSDPDSSHAGAYRKVWDQHFREAHALRQQRKIEE